MRARTAVGVAPPSQIRLRDITGAFGDRRARWRSHASADARRPSAYVLDRQGEGLHCESLARLRSGSPSAIQGPHPSRPTIWTGLHACDKPAAATSKALNPGDARAAAQPVAPSTPVDRALLPRAEQPPRFGWRRRCSCRPRRWTCRPPGKQTLPCPPYRLGGAFNPEPGPVDGPPGAGGNRGGLSAATQAVRGAPRCREERCEHPLRAGRHARHEVADPPATPTTRAGKRTGSRAPPAWSGRIKSLAWLSGAKP